MSPQLYVVYYRASRKSKGPIEKEYENAVTHQKERAKIDAMLDCVRSYGFDCPGIVYEKVKGVRGPVYELKIKAFGSEHRFLAGMPRFPRETGNGF